MSADPPPIDDELLSRMLDDDVDDDERARVDASPEAATRLAELRRAVAEVASPVEPLDESARIRLVGAAVAELGTGERSTDAAVGEQPRLVASPTLHAPRRWWSRAGWVAAAAVVLVVVGYGATRVGGGGRAADEAASDSAANSAAADGADLEVLDQVAMPPTALGEAPDADELLTRYDALATGSPATPDERAFGSETEGGASAPGSAAASTVDDDPCPPPPAGGAPDEVWRIVAFGTLPTGPVVVQAEVADPSNARLVVIDSVTCEVLAERP